jgi:hypothetical protein
LTTDLIRSAGDALRDPPPPVGAVAAVVRFDVLAGDEHQ